METPLAADKYRTLRNNIYKLFHSYDIFYCSVNKARLLRILWKVILQKYFPAEERASLYPCPMPCPPPPHPPPRPPPPPPSDPPMTVRISHHGCMAAFVSLNQAALRAVLHNYKYANIRYASFVLTLQVVRFLVAKNATPRPSGCMELNTRPWAGSLPKPLPWAWVRVLYIYICFSLTKGQCSKR